MDSGSRKSPTEKSEFEKERDFAMSREDSSEKMEASGDEDSSKSKDLTMVSEETIMEASTSVTKETEGPCIQLTQSKESPVSSLETFEKNQAGIDSSKQHDHSKVAVSADSGKKSASCESMLEPHSSTSLESDNMQKVLIPQRSSLFYELRTPSNVSDDESDVEKETRPRGLRRSFSKTSSQGDSSGDSCLDSKISESEDRSSSELLGGISGLYLKNVAHPSSEDDRDRPSSSKERDQRSNLSADVPVVTLTKYEYSMEYDPETGESATVEQIKIHGQVQEEEDNLIETGESATVEQIKTHGQVQEEEDKNLIETGESATVEQITTHGQVQEEEDKNLIETGESASAEQIKTYGHVQEEEDKNLMNPPTCSSRDSISPSKRKVDEIEYNPTSLQDQSFSENLEERPIKKGRISSELRPEDASENIAIPSLVRTDSDIMQQGSSSFPTSSHASKDSISPGKRKAGDDIEIETDSPEVLVRGEYRKTSSKRAKLKPRTQTAEGSDVSKECDELEKKSEPK